MIDVRDAVERAVEYMRTLPAQGDIRDVLLEEVELSDDERHWFITLSYLTTGATLLSGRKYKTFKVEASTGRVIAMKIREVR